VVDRAVALVGDDHIEVFDWDLRVVAHGLRLGTQDRL
jgi:hypothetical protein